MAPQRDWLEKDFYQVLGVSETADQKEITRAYRKLARENHPDTNAGDDAAEERFKDISSAYDVIGDAEKRKEYDELRKLGPMGGMFGGGAPGSGGGPGGFGFPGGADGADLGDLLGGLFGRRNRARGGPSRGAGPQRGNDLEAELHLDFDDAVNGLETTIHLTSDAACRTCAGSGAKPGTTPTTCPLCDGRGFLDDNQGYFSFSQPCPQCGGNGSVVTDPCPTCKGSGVERRPREVKVRLPAGVSDGQRIRLKGRGGPGANGGPAGDLYVIAHVNPHPIFGRKGKDLTIPVPVTFAEAALGANVTVPTLGGERVTIKVPPGTRSGRTFRVKGKGVPANKGTGDLLVTVEVAVPQKLSAAERKAVEALAAASDESPRAHLEGVS